MATAKIISIKQPSEKITTIHGFYECFLDNGVLKEQTYSTTGASSSAARNVAECRYKPTLKLPNVVMYKIENDCYYQSVETWSDRRLNFTANQLQDTSGNSTIASMMNNPQKMDNFNILKNQLSIMYPSSKVAGKLTNSQQVNAVFIAW
jgi:hypothetical protein